MLQKSKPKSQKSLRYKTSGSALARKPKVEKAPIKALIKSGLVKKLATAGLVDLKPSSEHSTVKTPQQRRREARLRIARKMDGKGTTRRGQILAKEAFSSLAGDPL